MSQCHFYPCRARKIMTLLIKRRCNIRYVADVNVWQNVYNVVCSKQFNILFQWFKPNAQWTFTAAGVGNISVLWSNHTQRHFILNIKLVNVLYDNNFQSYYIIPSINNFHKPGMTLLVKSTNHFYCKVYECRWSCFFP